MAKNINFCTFPSLKATLNYTNTKWLLTLRSTNSLNVTNTFSRISFSILSLLLPLFFRSVQRMFARMIPFTWHGQTFGLVHFKQLHGAGNSSEMDGSVVKTGTRLPFSSNVYP